MRTPFSWLADVWRPRTAILLGTLATPLALAAPAEAPASARKPLGDQRSVEALLAPRPAADAERARASLVEDNGAAAPGDAPERAGVAQGRYKLVTGAGLVLHRTGRPVHALRTVHVPGSAIELHTWEEEQEDGRREAHYAYSQGGTLPMGRVRATTLKVRLREAHFDPLRDVPPQVSGQLTADANNALHLVQFPAVPLPEFQEAIEGLGGKVLRFLSDHTYLVEMEPSVRARVAGLPFVRWVGPYHPEYRLDRGLRDAISGRAARLPAQRYSIMLGERGAERQQALAGLVRRLGGAVDLIEPGGLRVEATLNQEQLLQLARSNAVQFIDAWGGPGEVDMNIVRETGGANAVEALKGWTGQGVRGEIFDTELLTTHQEWSTPPIIHSTGTTGSLHGTSCYSNNFARGVDPAARGMLPSGQGIFFRYSESTQFGGTKSRYDINRELTDPAGPYRAVFQTSSVGSALVRNYTTVSAEVDDYLFKHPILSTQSQSNAGSQDSRPQAWAKNIVSVGAVRHLDTLARTDDRWGSSGSIGPAADGRIKPDLAFYYDSIQSATGSGNTNYTGFGGTSSATPQTAGHFGLLFQMWHEGVWAGHGRKADVFASRPQMATAKALMINMANRYNWLAGGSNGDIDRFKQGWGSADVKRLLDRAAVTSIIDETDPISPLGVRRYNVTVDPGQTELNVTLAYTDPMGTVGAAYARINDLSLRVTSPSGTVYWGNNGLTAGNFSSPGGVSNTRDTVENVFLQNPAAGTWKVEVLGDEIVQDARVETPQVDADFGLVVSGGRIVPEDAELSLPTFTNTYSYAEHTRGYWFTAPTDFTITMLQVPNEAGHALQNVEVVRFNPGTTPPTYTTTTNAFTSLFRAVGVPAGQLIEARIPVYAGDVIGILGGTGDATMMHSSYGNSPHTTSILGQPVTLNRLGMQYNLSTTPAKELWTVGGSLGRVRMFFGPLQQAAMPAFTYTYSYVSNTRGYWFTAPRDFTLTGLQVANESGHALQNVEVVRFHPGVTPPAYATTTNAFTSLFRAVGQPSGSVIRMTIPIKAGDVIGILGAAGDATNMHNSYGTAPFTSAIFDQPVTLNRLGMQYNLATTPAKELWTESSSLARVSLFYSR
jgi:hypothetical protein